VAASWQLVAALLAAFGDAEPSGSPPPRVQAPDIAELARATTIHGDEHVLKLTEACIRQHALTGDDSLLLAATAFTERIPPLRPSPAPVGVGI
jgi:hypothetical protein